MSFAETWAPALLEEMGIALDDPDYAAKLAAAEKSLVFVLAITERYLDRKLEYLADEVETFGPAPSKRLVLRRYPVEAVSELTIAGSVLQSDCFYVNKEAGVVWLGAYAGWSPSITYAGGYPDDAWPPELLMVVMELAASVYPGISTPGVPVLGAIDPAVKRVSVPDVGTIEYAGDGGAGSVGFGVIPQAYSAVLDRFRAASIVGGA